MKQAARLSRPSPLPTAPAAANRGVLVQAKSGLGPGPGTMVAPPIADAGRPLDGTTRSSMESGFGRDFGRIRVHDDARAHDNARDLSARAYAAGDHIIFGEGHYRPETDAGRALIAHELAHSVQQGGVQMKADGPLPAAADAELERQADRAAAAVTAGRPAPALSHIGAPAVFRADATTPPPAPSPPDPANAPPKAQTTKGATNVPDWVVGFENDSNPADLAPAYLGVRRGPAFKMPTEKGANDSVQQAYKRGGAVSTVYTTGNMSSYKEGLSSDGYQQKWLNKYGYTSFGALSKAILASTDPDVIAVLDRPAGPNSRGFATNRKFAAALAGGIRNAGCAVDHIVEKHMGGASVPSNLQLFDEKRNSASGSQSWNEVKKLIDELRSPSMRGAKATQIQIFYSSVEVDPGPADPSFEIETLVQTKVTGSEAVKKKAEGLPVNLVSGPNHAVSHIKDKGESDIDSEAERVVQGMKLQKYIRRGGKLDDAVGELDHKALKKLKANDAVVKIKAEKLAASAPTASTTEEDGAAVEPARETRKFETLPGPQKIPIEYPNLSPGFITSLGINDQGQLTGSGVIYPRIKFLGELHFAFDPDTLKLTAPLDMKRLKSPIAGFRFTGGSFDLQLAPSLVPSGTVSFEIGPAQKPIIVGDITAKPGENGGFAATGDIRPGKGIPGAESATGKIGYDSQKGWFGSLDISSNAIANTNIKVAVKLQQKGDQLDITAVGGAIITVNKKEFNLKARWEDGGITYYAFARWEKPFSIVDSIQADVTYRNNYLKITGGGSFHFREWKGHIDLVYERYNERVKASGHGNVEVETKDKKGKGSLDANIDEKGKLWGKGKIRYAVTPKIVPELEVELDKEDKLRVLARVTLGPYPVIPKYPKDPKPKPLLKFGTPDIPFPTPIPGLTGFIEFYARVGYYITFGEGKFTKIVIGGTFDPLEADPVKKIEADADFECPAKVGLEGKFGANAGLKVLMGAGKLAGGLSITPGIEASAKFVATARAKYENSQFMLGLKAGADLRLDAKLVLAGEITASALWGLLSHTWEFPIAAPTTTLGSKHVDLGEFALVMGDNDRLPGAEEKSKLNEFDPIDIVKDILGMSKRSSAPNPDYDPNARPPRDYIGHNI